jgi:hypothetical protein
MKKVGVDKKAAPKKAAAKKVAAVAPNISDAPKVVTATIADQTVSGEFRTFKKGSKGWYLGGKIYVNGLKCQMSCSITIIGTKPQEETNG